MGNLMILPAVEPKRISWLNEYATDAEIITDIPQREKKTLPFIEANTKAVELSHLKNECIVPVFSKDNELTISHPAFIETVAEAVSTFYNGETIETPEIRVSHIIKGRIPEAIHKPANQLLESDKTIYYERMMFCIEIPTIYETIEGNKLTLTVGGVRAYNHMNLYSKKSVERFKIFVGFKNADTWQHKHDGTPILSDSWENATVSSPTAKDTAHHSTVADYRYTNQCSGKSLYQRP